jgi:hypothetical protein
MPYKEPPDDCPGTLSLLTLPAGTELFHVHPTARNSCLPTYLPPHPFKGGRFDSLRDTHGQLYCGETECAAIYEALLRDQPFTSDGAPRAVSTTKVQIQSLAKVRTNRDLILINILTLDELAQIGQEDRWLHNCDSSHYVHTQYWGDRLISWATADGIIWTSRFADPAFSLVIFERLAPHPHNPILIEDGSEKLLLGDARLTLDDCLRQRRATLGP